MWHPRGEMSIPHGCKCNCHNGIIFNDQHTSPYQTCFYWLNKISWYRDLTRNFVNIYHSKLLVVVWIYPKNYLSYYFFSSNRYAFLRKTNLTTARGALGPIGPHAFHVGADAAARSFIIIYSFSLFNKNFLYINYMYNSMLQQKLCAQLVVIVKIIPTSYSSNNCA